MFMTVSSKLTSSRSKLLIKGLHIFPTSIGGNYHSWSYSPLVILFHGNYLSPSLCCQQRLLAQISPSRSLDFSGLICFRVLSLFDKLNSPQLTSGRNVYGIWLACQFGRYNYRLKNDSAIWLAKKEIRQTGICMGWGVRAKVAGQAV